MNIIFVLFARAAPSVIIRILLREGDVHARVREIMGELVCNGDLSQFVGNVL